jgi:endonuclease-8
VPEGDTIYRSARALGRALTGKTVTRFESGYAQLVQADDQLPFAGQTVTLVEARGKWLLMHFSAGSVLATHMLMTGSWHIYRPGERWQAPRRDLRVLLETEDFVAVGFRIPLAKIHTEASLARDLRIPPPAADLLRAEFAPAQALARLTEEGREELANALLNQRLLAGVGNVFKSEICFLLGLSPFALLGSLSETQLQAVVAMAQKLLAANVLEDSGDRIVTFQGRRRRTTNASDPKENLWVYGRTGEPCRKCGEPIRRCLQGPDARSTYWCPRCQPLPAPAQDR